MTDPSEIRYAKIQERLEPCVTELNIKNKTVKVVGQDVKIPKPAWQRCEPDWRKK